ncbi:glycosyl hydrolase [Patescibacteria group bacterium]
MLQDFYLKASKIKKLLIKLGIVYGLILTTGYALFRAYYINFNPYLVIPAILLYMAELHTIILLYGFLYSLWPRKFKTYSKINRNRNLQVNLFITTVGEPIEIVSQTIEHAKKAADHYRKIVKPKKAPRVIVLNDGFGAKKENWWQVRDFCQKVGVLHLARKTNEGFKAGNINNGLKKFPSKDPHNTIDCYFDADFCAKKEFLIEILKPLVDNKVDFVQSPQRYKNLTTWVAKGAGAHQIFFFDYVCPAKAYDNALFLCGTNYAIRRQALLDAGGVDNRFVTEDYATSIKLHLLGKKGVFVSKVLALGMAPMNLKEYFNQQTRWCKGCLDANGKYLKELLFGPLNFRQKLHYFLSTAYYFIGVRDLILVLAPIPYLFFGISLIRANTTMYLAFVYLPLMIFNFSLFFLTFRSPVKSLVLDIVTFPVFALAFVSSVIKKNLPFTVTIKKYEKENPFRVYKIQLAVATLLCAGIAYSFLFNRNHNPYGKFINHFWATYSATFLLLGFFLVIRENYDFSRLENHYSNLLGTLKNALGFTKRFALRPAVAFVAVIIAFIFLGYSVKTGVLAYDDIRTTFNKIIKREELLVPDNGAYYGYFLPELNSHPESPVISTVEGDHPSLVMYYQDFSPDSQFNLKFMNMLYEKGSIPIVTWEPWIRGSDQEKIINQEGQAAEEILSGKYNEHIRQWARGAKKFGKPFFLRFAHEMNGNWYAWGSFDENSASQYKKMWKHVFTIFKEEKVDNAIWVWSPNNTNQYGLADSMLDFYPGSEYVDWTGFSAFNWGNSYSDNRWMDFKTSCWEAYSTLAQLNKPIMVAETSSVSIGGDKTEWFRQTLEQDIPSMPLIRGVVLFNEDYQNADFILDKGMDANEMVKHHLLNNGYYLTNPILQYR